MTETGAKKAPNITLWVAVGLFIFAFGLRLAGIGWGLKNEFHHQSYHPDELVIFAASQQIEPGKGKFTPGFYNYGTAYLTALRVASDMVTAYSGGPSSDPETPATPDQLWSWVSRVHMAGRIIAALCGAGTVVLVFLALRRFIGLFGSIFGALLPAVAPAFVMHSRFQTVDVPGTFWIAFATYFALRLLPTADEQESAKPMNLAMLSGLGAGLAAGTKYTGILVLVTLAIAALMGRKQRGLPLLGVGTAVALAVFALSTPGLLLDTQKFLDDFKYEITHTSTGHGLVFVGTSPGFLYHLGNLLAGVGPILTLLGLIGLAFGVWRREPFLVAAFAFALLTYFLIGRAEVKFLRYTFPLIIGLSFGFGYLMDWAEKNRKLGQVIAALGIAGIGGLDPGGLRQALAYTLWMTGEDPRDTAIRYLRTQDDNVGLASDPWFYSVPTFPDSASSRAVPFDQRMAAMQDANPPTLFYQPINEPPFNFDVRLITESKPDRIVASSFEYGDPLRIKASGIMPRDEVEALLVNRANDFMTKLKAEYEVEKVLGFDGVRIHDLEYVRPEITIWKRKVASSPTSNGF